jgi:two-component sensor histidine kinase
MKAQLQMLEKDYFGKLSDKQKESLSIIIRNTDRLDNIIVDFLEISRIEAARLKFNFVDVNLSETLQETVQFMQGFAKEKNISLIINTDDLPIIEADSDRVSQVLRNLITNAIKFSEEKSTIEIDAKLRQDEILISVRDYGTGISPEDQIRIFEPFYQVEKHSKRHYGGTGLGLAICRGIVESQNGKIWVESKIGRGSKFNFTIPLEPVRDIKPIKVLFSQKAVIEKKLKEEFQTMLGPLGSNEFNELKNKNSLGKDDLLQYVDTLIEQFIITDKHGINFKSHISEIFGEEKELNKNLDTLYGPEEVLIRS